jgi:hypothetical protein
MNRFLFVMSLWFFALSACQGEELSLWDKVEVLRQRSCVEQKPAYDYYHTEWCGLERIKRVGESVDSRLRGYEAELAQKGLSEARLFQILVAMKYIYKYEHKSETDYLAMESWLEKLACTYAPARFELLFSRLQTADLLTLEGNGRLRELLAFDGLFPYDNGYLPKATKEYITFMAIISDMATGQKSDLTVPAGYFGFRGMPLGMLYDFAFDRRERGYTAFLGFKEPALLREMLGSVLEPMYMPVRPTERQFLAGLAASEVFSSVATELFLNCLTKEPRLRSVEHGLGVLASHYMSIGAYDEAVSVAESLAKFYPRSGWLRND